jgi:hypothetical protein
MESVSGMEPLSSTGFIGWGVADEGCGALKLKGKDWEVEGVEVEGVGSNVKRSAACWCIWANNTVGGMGLLWQDGR